MLLFVLLTIVLMAWPVAGVLGSLWVAEQGRRDYPSLVAATLLGPIWLMIALFVRSPEAHRREHQRRLADIERQWRRAGQ